MADTALSAKPNKIRPTEKPTARQKAACPASSNSRARAAIGETSRMGSATHQAASCHTSSQNSTAQMGSRAFLLAFVVEGVIGHSAAHRGGILVKENLQIAGKAVLHFLAVDIRDAAIGSAALATASGMISYWPISAAVSSTFSFAKATDWA